MTSSSRRKISHFQREGISVYKERLRRNETQINIFGLKFSFLIVSAHWNDKAELIKWINQGRIDEVHDNVDD